MVAYEDDTVFPAPRAAVWRLLDAHREDDRIGRIHPLISGQKTLDRSDTESTVERWIDVRGKGMRSVWKLTYRPPESARWEVVESQGPWAPGSYVDSRYLEVDGGTLIQARGDLKISVLPFFLPQRSTVRKVLDDIHNEDVAYLTRAP